MQELIYEITTAIDTRDVNRLGAVYHWVGLNAASGDSILDRLQTVVDRPLVDIVPLRAASAPIVADRRHRAADRARRRGSGTAATASNPPTIARNAETNGGETSGNEAPVSRPPARRAPVGLRLYRPGKSDTRRRPRSVLRKHLDCWWITL